MRFVIAAFLFLTHFAASAKIFYTAQDFQHDITTHSKIIFYFVSQGMPLSMPGLNNVLEAARALGYEVQALNDPVGSVSSGGGQSIPIALPSPYTSAAGVPLHFPIIYIYKNGHPCGPAVPGYKSLSGYQQIISLYDQQCEHRVKIKKSHAHLTASQFYTASTIMETPVPRKNIAYYFKPIDNDWVTYHASNQVYFFNRKTGIEFMVPGQFDCVPTPDARFATLPAPLRFFSLAKIWADPNHAMNLPPDFLDQNMKDEYQSIGIVQDSQSTRIYRVVTGWSATVAFQEYSFDKITEKIMSKGPSKALCKSAALSLPMLSKDGLMLGGQANGDAFTKIVSIGVAGSECKLVKDLGSKTGKVAFSHDGNQVAFVVKDGDAIKAYVYHLKTNALTLLMAVSEAKKEYIVFPDFLPNGNVLAMKVQRNVDGAVQGTLLEMQLYS